jgi:hypothetical protein
MFVKITNGAVDQYPYTVGDLRRDNPNTSFPRSLPDQLLADWGMYPVTEKSIPSYDARTQKVTADTTPAQENGDWVIGWTISNKTSDEVSEYDANAESTNRGIRDNLLEGTDWWALPDSPTMTAEQTAYRQALRDITTHANWPNLNDDDWPVKP